MYIYVYIYSTGNTTNFEKSDEYLCVAIVTKEGAPVLGTPL